MIAVRPGFNAMLINWGAPDQVRTDRCSYCGDIFPTEEEDDGFIPLIMWNAEGWTAEFCEHCQVTWFGLQTFPELPEEEQ